MVYLGRWEGGVELDDISIHDELKLQMGALQNDETNHPLTPTIYQSTSKTQRKGKKNNTQI
jgi:hypothetical protein